MSEYSITVYVEANSPEEALDDLLAATSDYNYAVTDNETNTTYIVDPTGLEHEDGDHSAARWTTDAPEAGFRVSI